mmetsp:Transcript_33707/g.65602  ORF Transcript_33707/g.65602 Transcript_33707/m.65602 type:complete len:289 (+) Transcript_33707:1070-1936(+)
MLAHEEMSGNASESCVWALMNPGACSEGTSTTWPWKRPVPLTTEKVPVDSPPMTGSLSSFHSWVVLASPSKVASTISSAVALVEEARRFLSTPWPRRETEPGWVYVLNVRVPQGPAFCEVLPAATVYPSEEQVPFSRPPFATTRPTGQMPTMLPRQLSAQVPSTTLLYVVQASAAPPAAVAAALAQPVAPMESISRWTVPLAPSAHTVMVLMSRRVPASGQTLGSLAHVLLGSPVASELQLLKFVKGISTSWNVSSAEAGMSKCDLNPPVKKLQPKLFLVPKDIRYPA